MKNQDQILLEQAYGHIFEQTRDQQLLTEAAYISKYVPLCKLVERLENSSPEVIEEFVRGLGAVASAIGSGIKNTATGIGRKVSQVASGVGGAIGQMGQNVKNIYNTAQAQGGAEKSVKQSQQNLQKAVEFIQQLVQYIQTIAKTDQHIAQTINNPKVSGKPENLSLKDIQSMFEVAVQQQQTGATNAAQAAQAARTKGITGGAGAAYTQAAAAKGQQQQAAANPQAQARS